MTSKTPSEVEEKGACGSRHTIWKPVQTGIHVVESLTAETANRMPVLGASLSLQARLKSDLRDANVRYGALQRSLALRDARRAKGCQIYKDVR